MTDQTDDHLISSLLHGYLEQDKTGLFTMKYLTGPAEAAAKHKLAQLLRSKKSLPRDIRNSLANLLEEEPAPDHYNERVLRFHFRQRGRRRDRHRHLEITACVLMLIEADYKTEAAVAFIGRRFHLSRSEVFKIVKANKAELKHIRMARAPLRHISPNR